MDKIKVYHFHNGAGGGVLSVIKNLLRFSANSFIENHVIYVVNKSTVPQFNIEPLQGAVSQQVHYYTAANNFFYTCRQLVKLIPDDKAIIVAHDWVELGMASNLGLQNPVVHVLHGDVDYYYELAQKHEPTTDAFICISPKIFELLKQKLPKRLDDIFYLNYPVPSVGCKTPQQDFLRLIYYVRDLKDNRKQFSTVIEISRLLSTSPANYFFTIAGGGITEEEFFEIWPGVMKNRVSFKGLKTNEEIVQLLPDQDVFLLPSLAEGFPVSLVEAMKAGLVPLVTKWDTAVDELIEQGITGYYFAAGDAPGYAFCIKSLQKSRQVLQELSDNCQKIATTLFDPVKNAKKFEVIFLGVSSGKQQKKHALKIYGSRLDENWIPNFITKTIRSL